jgi:hypothetical protein
LIKSNAIQRVEYTDPRAKGPSDSSLVERVKAVVAFTLVERVVGDGIDSTVIDPTVGSKGSTTGTGNEGDHSSNDTDDDTSRDNRGDDHGDRRNSAFTLSSNARSCILDARHCVAISVAGAGVADNCLVVTSVESDADFRNAKSGSTRTSGVGRGAAYRDVAHVLLARVLEVAKVIVGDVHTARSGVAAVGGAVESVGAIELSEAASARSRVAGSDLAHVVGPRAIHWGVDAGASSSVARVDRAVITVVAVNGSELATSEGVA